MRSNEARSPGFEDLAPGLAIDGRSRGRWWQGDTGDAIPRRGARFPGFAASAPGLAIDGRNRRRWWRRGIGAGLRCPKARRPSGGGGVGVCVGILALPVHTGRFLLAGERRRYPLSLISFSLTKQCCTGCICSISSVQDFLDAHLIYLTETRQILLFLLFYWLYLFHWLSTLDVLNHRNIAISCPN